jgi:hypothetical protein
MSTQESEAGVPGKKKGFNYLFLWLVIPLLLLIIGGFFMNR